MVFVDETGHEAFRGSPMFAFAGCACRSSDYDALIAQPWRRLVDEKFGGDARRMHASEFRPSAEQAADLGAFFVAGRFHRLGAAIRDTSVVSGYETRVGACLDTLFHLTREVLDSISPVFAVHFIFEESERLRAAVERHHSPRAIEAPLRADRVPANYHWQPKSALEPGLQVADFIAHAVHGQVVMGNQRGGYQQPRKDFESVFSPHSPALNHYLEINSAHLTAKLGR